MTEDRTPSQLLFEAKHGDTKKARERAKRELLKLFSDECRDHEDELIRYAAQVLALHSPPHRPRGTRAHSFHLVAKTYRKHCDRLDPEKTLGTREQYFGPAVRATADELGYSERNVKRILDEGFKFS